MNGDKSTAKDPTSSISLEETRTAGEALEEIRRNSRSQKEKGLAFERLCLELLKALPEYGLTEVETFSGWKQRSTLGFSGSDLGIDLVGTKEDGSFCAIQCKCFDPSHKVAKKDIDSFLVESGKEPYSSRIVIATCPWNHNAEKSIEQQKTPVQRIDFDSDLASVPIEWKGTRPRIRPETRTPLPLQREAISRAVGYFQEEERGFLQMACGTGKTFTSLKICEEILGKGNGKAGNILFVAPSLALVSQAHREWLRFRDLSRNMETLIVCSDRSAGRAGSNDIRPQELAASPTTDPEKLANRMRGISKKTRVVVFCTYQSLEVIRQAQSEHRLPAFDIAVADEAHRTTGKVTRDRQGDRIYENFQLFHDSTRILAKKRLYMTATPRIYNPGTRRTFERQNDPETAELLDMENFELFGEKIYHLGFRRAVEHDMLSDFKVIVLMLDSQDPLLQKGLLNPALPKGKTDKAIDVQLTDDGKALGALMAVTGHSIDEDEKSPGVLQRVVAFSSSIQRSKDLVSRLSSPVAQGIFSDLVSEHVDGTDTALNRNRKFRQLRSPEKSVHVLSNAKLLTEGIDIPSLDAVVFADSKDSQVEVVQAVGRVMRKAPGKRYGYVIVPVLLSEPLLPFDDGYQEELEQQFASKDFRTLWQVVAALRSHDERFRLGEDLEKKILVFRGRTSLPRERSNQKSSRSSPQEQETSRHSVTAEDMTKASQEFVDRIQARILRQVGNQSYSGSTAGQIGFAVKTAASLLRRANLGGCLVPVLDTGDDTSKGHLRTLTIASLMLFNGCLMQVLLKKHGHIGGISGLGEIRAGGRKKIPQKLLEDWRLILERDYFPIYVLPAEILETLTKQSGSGNPDFLQALVRLMNCAEENAESIASMNFDHAGPLYHRLLPTAESDGAFYTKNISAMLLAGLAMGEDFCDWKDPERVKNLKVIDPAMGTGTLLMAALRRIKEMHAAAMENPDMERDSKLHQEIVENCINGLDINSHAVQMAAMSLSIGATGTNYSKINLFTMPHGLQKDGSVKAGSLELLDQGDGPQVLQLGSGTPFGENRKRNKITDFDAIQVDDVIQMSSRDNMEGTFQKGSADLVIMNPPFSSNVKEGTKFSPEVRRSMQKRKYEIAEIAIKANPESGSTIDSNSTGGYFNPIGDMLLKENGTLAFIGATTLCIGKSQLKQRKYLAKNYQIETIVTSHDPAQISFVENTAIHMSMFVLRRNQKGTTKPVQFLNLRKMPETQSQVMEILSWAQSKKDSSSCTTDFDTWGGAHGERS